MENSGLFFNLVPLIVFLPVVGLLVNIIFGKRMNEKATKARLAAFNIISMDMNTINALRRIKTPRGPIVNNIDETVM